jgi:hypothetical protein
MPELMNIIIRLAIILIAGYALWEFSDTFSLALAILAKPQESRWFNVLSALHELVLGPALAVAAMALAIANKRLLLAAILEGTALVVYFIPLIVFLASMMIYGF